MKQYLKKYDDGSYVLMDGAGYSGQENWIAIPEGADCLTSCANVLIFWKGQDYSFDLEDDNDWVHCSCDSMTLDYYLDFYKDTGVYVVWQREPSQTLNDKVASVDMAQQELKGVDATLAQRQSTYGSFTQVANTTGQLMAVIRNSPNGSTLPYAHEEALHMICSKIARIMNGDFNHLDSWHDIGGYSKLIENLIEGKNEL